MSDPPSGRTTSFARLAPPDRSGRRMFMVSTALVALIMVFTAVLCNGLSLLGALATAPFLSLLAAITAAVCGLPYLVVILWVDRNEPEPPWLVLSALLWGGVTATGVSVLFNTMFGVVIGAAVADPAVASQLTASFSAPLVEEISKGFALLVLYAFFRRDVDTVLDGIVYGALIGLGFAVVENWMYYVNSGSVAGVLALTLVRGVITSVGTHMCFTALTGAGVGMFRVLRGGVVRWFLPPAALALAMFSHFTWNTLAGLIVATLSDNEIVQMFVGLPLAVVVLQIPFVLLVVVMAAIALRHENRIISVYLADERDPVLRDGELAAMLPARRRTFHLLLTLTKEGPGAWWHQRGRFARLVQLAFEKWHMDQEAALASSDVREHAIRVRQLRKELSA